MAEVALGIATSHSPMLSTPYEAFAGLAEIDRARLPEFADRARDHASRIGRELRAEVTRARHDATQAAIHRLATLLAGEAPDVLVVIGDDQAEWFSADNQPALCIYWGESVENLPPPAERLLPLRRLSYWGYYGDGVNRAFPVDAAFGKHLVETLTHEHDFDVAHIRVQPRHGPFGHAWGFVHQRLMGARVIPIVPVLLNTYFPPNQPTPRRCYRLGQAIRKAVEAWPTSKRVGIVASGGLSHFFVDEELDRHVLRILAEKDIDAVAALPAAQLESGNSEIRNWLAAAGALEHLHMRLLDYVPCYRSEAGTGVGMAFAVWQ
jgi:3-O-methylgallate 3,4-dioxygenase